MRILQVLVGDLKVLDDSSELRDCVAYVCLLEVPLWSVVGMCCSALEILGCRKRVGTRLPRWRVECLGDRAATSEPTPQSTVYSFCLLVYFMPEQIHTPQ
jgi:hypothetical protein